LTKAKDLLGAGVVILGRAASGWGAWQTAESVVIDEKAAADLASTKWNGNESLKQALMAQSRAAQRGLILIVIGSVLQGVGIVIQVAAQNARR
jgi:hypothetical protein